nr:DUF3265 domain-containing protein [Vibrio parahaemolyticus]
MYLARNSWLKYSLGGNFSNKQFKWDSARVAFLVCGDLGVEVLCSG